MGNNVSYIMSVYNDNNSQDEIYKQEFELNLNHQFENEKFKGVFVVGYNMEPNIYLFSIIMPFKAKDFSLNA